MTEEIILVSSVTNSSYCLSACTAQYTAPVCDVMMRLLCLANQVAKKFDSRRKMS